jgi:uncharacterized protein (DUF2252 family)
LKFANPKIKKMLSQLLLLLLLTTTFLTTTALTPTNRSSIIKQRLLQQNLGDGLGFLQYNNYVIRQERYSDEASNRVAFFTANSFLWWIDYGQDSRLDQFPGKTWICGDAHLDNFGTFHIGDVDGQPIFDVNDFDQAVISDYKLDLWRLATSISLAIKIQTPTSSMHPDDPTVISNAIDSLTTAYYNAIARSAGNDSERTSHILNRTIITPIPSSAPSPLSYPVGRLMGKVTIYPPTPDPTKYGRTGSNGLPKYSYLNPNTGTRMFNRTSDLVNASDYWYNAIVASMPTSYGPSLNVGSLSYSASHFQVKDIIQRLHSGGGSRGVWRFYVLIEGPTNSSQDDDVILDVKYQPQCNAFGWMLPEDENWMKLIIPSAYANNALRGITGQYANLVGLNKYSGYVNINNLWFTVREISPWKESLKYTPGDDIKRDTHWQEAAQWFGDALATAHARGDADYNSTQVPGDFDYDLYQKISVNLTGWKNLIYQVAIEASTQYEWDWRDFVDQYNAGEYNYTVTPTVSPTITTMAPSRSPTTVNTTNGTGTHSPTRSSFFNNNNVPTTPASTSSPPSDAIIGGILGGVTGLLIVLTIAGNMYWDKIKQVTGGLNNTTTTTNNKVDTTSTTHGGNLIADGELAAATGNNVAAANPLYVEGV